MFRKLITGIATTSVQKKAGIEFLSEMKHEFNTKKFPLQQLCLISVNSLLDVINGNKPADSYTYINAGFLDSSSVSVN